MTDAIILGTIVLLGIYEAWTLANDKSGDTISESVWRVASKRPLIPFLAGMLAGHFFWQAAP